MGDLLRAAKAGPGLDARQRQMKAKKVRVIAVAISHVAGRDPLQKFDIGAQRAALYRGRWQADAGRGIAQRNRHPQRDIQTDRPCRSARPSARRIGHKDRGGRRILGGQGLA